MPSCVLAYSGGLDTSVILGWLQEEGYDVHAVYVDLGQPCEDREAILKKARDIGAASARIVDAREELCRDFAFPVLMWRAKYESIYLLGTSIARPLISKACLEVAREVRADAYAHGATGKGNDQCRFQLAAEALQPDIQVIAPWRMQRFRDAFPGRTAMIEYCRERAIPVKASVEKPYSSDENCLHISYEAGQLEDLAVNGVELVDFGMTVSPQQAPDEAEEVTIAFREGVPVSVNGQDLSPLGVVEMLNSIGGKHGVGRIDMVENRFVGMKSRGVLRSAGHDVALRSHHADRTAHAGSRLAASAGQPGARRGRSGVLRLLVHAQDGRLVRLHSTIPPESQWASDLEAVQGQRHGRALREPQQPV